MPAIPDRTVSVDFKVIAGHRLMRHKGKCSNLHGHNYVFTVCLRSLTGDLDGGSMVIDFDEVQVHLRDWLEQVDHVLFLNKEDIALAVAIQGCLPQRIYLLDGDPTAENLAEEFYEECARVFGPGMVVHTVCQEVEGSSATYFP